MNAITLFGPLFGISFLIERILEGAFNIVELYPGIEQWKTSPDDAVKKKYSDFKQIVSVIVGILVGVIITNALDMAFFSQFDRLGQIDHYTDKLLAGAIAGAMAPYSHQLLEFLLKLQRLFDAQKKRIESGEITVNSDSDSDIRA